MYYKLWQVLQIRTIITNWGITANLLFNKYIKQMCCKKNKSLFFDVTKNGQISLFLSDFKSLSFSIQYENRFLFSR